MSGRCTASATTTANEQPERSKGFKNDPYHHRSRPCRRLHSGSRRRPTAAPTAAVSTAPAAAAPAASSRAKKKTIGRSRFFQGSWTQEDSDNDDSEYDDEEDDEEEDSDEEMGRGDEGRWHGQKQQKHSHHENPPPTSLPPPPPPQQQLAEVDDEALAAELRSLQPPEAIPTHQRVREGLETTRAYLHHISEVSDCIGRSVLLGGRQAPAHGRTRRECSDRVGTRRLSGLTHLEGAHLTALSVATAAIARPLVRLGPTLSVGGRALVAAADTAVVARGLMYTSVRQASSDLASAVLGPESGPVVAEGMDTVVAAQATASWVSCTGIGWLVQGDSLPTICSTLAYEGGRQRRQHAGLARRLPRASPQRLSITSRQQDWARRRQTCRYPPWAGHCLRLVVRRRGRRESSRRPSTMSGSLVVVVMVVEARRR